MIFKKTKLAGAFVIDVEPHEDFRGFLAQSWSAAEFAAHGLNPTVAECNVSFSKRAGTLRGMHFQLPPRAQVKVVRCTTGAIFDAIIDLRSDSPTFKQWIGVELTAANHRMLYVPAGFAHGFQTLVDNSEIFYQMSDVYAPELSGGVRWNDPAFGIEWPAAERIIIERDMSYPDFTE